MPTVVEMAGLKMPEAAQGQSLRTLLTADAKGAGTAKTGSGWSQRPVIAERQPQGGDEVEREIESYSIMEGDWKLIHNITPPPNRAEFELFDFYKDPLDQKNLAAEHADVVSDKPGKCPKCEMDLVPTSTVSHGKTAEQPQVQIDHARR
jgi:arylsulfatase A-like enzyme